jgi:hypothetical protein
MVIAEEQQLNSNKSKIDLLKTNFSEFISLKSFSKFASDRIIELETILNSSIEQVLAGDIVSDELANQ